MRRIFSQSAEALDFLLFLFFDQAKKRKYEVNIYSTSQEWYF